MNYVFSPLQKFLLTWLLVIVTGWLTIRVLSYVGELVSILLTAGLIAFLLNYAVVALRPILPRPIAAVVVYLSTIVLVVFVVLTLLPLVYDQGTQLIARLPELLAQGQQQLIDFQSWSTGRNLPFDVEILTSQLLARIQTAVETLTGKSVGLVLGTFNWFFDFILIIVISFYMLIDGERLWEIVTSFFVPRIQQELTTSLQKNLRLFVTGQLLLGLFMATSLTIVFRLLQVPFFLLFSVFIGFMEIIPFVGATLGISAVFIVVTFIDWWLALQVLAVSVGVQQIKDNVVAPRILGNLTGLSPVIIFVCLLLGAKIGGFLGVILAIPFTGVVKSLVEILADPDLPPQTGAFFLNPLKKHAIEAALPSADRATKTK